MLARRCGAGVRGGVAGARPGAFAAGRIKVVSGSAFIVRAGDLIPAQAGQMMFETDGLRTGADGASA
jgi:hypothetical protein